MDIKDIKDLIITINNTDIERVEIQKDNTKVIISKGSSNKDKDSTFKASNTIEVADDKKLTQREEISLENENLYIVKSPMVGTYYQAPGPGEESFVKIGGIVEKGQTLCIIEAMKLMNEIEAEVAGEVVEILVKNEDIVQYGQPLMKIRRV
ncbi:MAG: acetyl-CoA carboxylase biotin carboxyl carrier protein [Tissierellia bacterium]|nr:acetyl-CoA carboxylase biotin carboxyl carrier protein [Tissierellia bacterium]